MFLDSLNTNQFEPVTDPAYDSVFNRRPRVYSYSHSSREIPREEDFHDLDEETPETPSLDEVNHICYFTVFAPILNSMLKAQVLCRFFSYRSNLHVL